MKTMKIVVTYKRVKRLSMRVTQKGEVHVSAPVGTPREVVRQFIGDNQLWIERTFANMQQRMLKRELFYGQLPLGTKEQKTDAIRRMDTKILPLVARYQELMGVRCSGIEYKAVISRWGSCNVRTKRLTFSVYLLLLPDWCVEHVVVHELAHLIVPNHGPAFHQVMDAFFPRWREARAETRRICKNEESF